MRNRIWIVSFCIALSLAATASGAPPAKPSHTSVSSNSINGTETFQWSQDGHRIKIRTEGKVELTEDWTGIARLSRGAEMRLEEEDGRVERRLDVEPGGDGRPVYTWKVDGKERAFDAEGKKWLRSMLLQFVRGTGYDADRRVAWFLKTQGPNGLLAEVSQIPGDYVKGIYLKKLFAQRGLGAGVVERALQQAGREIRSDYELAQALIAAAGSQALNEPAARAYGEAARSIESDYEQRRALSELTTELTAKGQLTPGVLAVVLQTARGIDSDYELASLLTGVPASALGDAAARSAYLQAAETIGSDYEHHRALSAAVASGKLAGDSLLGVLRSAQGIQSDYERASLLIEIAGKYSLSGPARDAYARAASSIRSKYERGRAEEALKQRSR
jgi:hypothetical protein